MRYNAFNLIELENARAIHLKKNIKRQLQTDVSRKRRFPGNSVGESVHRRQKGERRESVKDRKKQRENRRKKNQEELLDRRDKCGVEDLTAYNAVRQIRSGGKAEIILR